MMGLTLTGRAALLRAGRLLILAAFALPLGACSSGEECDRCTSDDDCNAGTVCTTFSDDSRRCGSGLGETSCRVR